jgi:hypothetical protein
VSVLYLVARRRAELSRAQRPALRLSVSCPSACPAIDFPPSVPAVQLHVADEVLCPFVGSEVDVRLSEKLFQGGWSFLEDGSDESRAVRPAV